MQRRDFVVAAGAMGVVAASGVRNGPDGRQCGISFDSFGGQPGPADFASIRELGATHIAFTPFGFMRSHAEPEVLRSRRPGRGRTRSESRLVAMGRMARSAGLEVLVIPTIANFRNGRWRGDIAMTDDASWARWFGSYRDFLLHYATLATDIDSAGLCVGTELKQTVDRADEWRGAVAAIRDRFDGWLTYAANWDDYDEVTWWDAVDYVGVQAYFELGVPPASQPAARKGFLLRAWAPIRDRLASLSRRLDRRVVFTEIGYQSHEGSTARPWEWNLDRPVDFDIQAEAYRAAFEALWHEPWLAGMYWWKWHTAAGLRRDRSRDFTPQGKPAAQVVRRWYGSGDGHR